MMRNGLVLAFFAAGLVVWVARRVSPDRFRRLKWTLVGAAGGAWGLFAVVMLWSLWDVYYQHFYSNWSRWLAPMAAVLYGLVGLALWWLALRLPGNPAVNFCLLGGLESVPEHLLGIYRLKILERVPMLQGADPVAILVFAVFEYVFYWSCVLGLALVAQSSWRWWVQRRHSHTLAV